AREAEAVEVGGVVARDARGEHVLFPGAGGQLEPLELAHDREQALPAVKLRAGVDVLPAQQKAHQVGRAHRLDLAPQRPQREAVDAGEEPPLAPFLLVGPGREATAQRDAAALEPGEAHGDAAWREADARSEGDRRDGAQDLEPPPDGGAERLLLRL